MKMIERTVEGWSSEELEYLGACPVCAATSRRPGYTGISDHLYGTVGTWTYWKCNRCGAMHLDPRPTRAAIKRAYDNYYTHPDHASPGRASAARLTTRIRQGIRNEYVRRELGYDLRPAISGGDFLARFLPRIRRQGNRFVRHLSLGDEPRPRLLDVGCGDGAFLEQMASLGWDCEGIEPDRTAAEAAQQRGLRVACEPFTEPALQGRLATYDAVTLSHVIEHLHEPNESLVLARQLLRPGGTIWIATPNLLSAGHRLFGPSWRGLEPPRHLVLFTFRSLADALARAGFVSVTRRPSAAAAQRMFRESSEIARRSHRAKRLLIQGRPAAVAATIAEVAAGRWLDVGEELVVTAASR